MPVAQPKTRAQKEAVRKRNLRRRVSADTAEIGTPELTDEHRAEGQRLWDLCRNSLLNFNIHCFPNSTGLKPFGRVQEESIAHDEAVILNGGQLTKAEPRAYGKTSRGCNAAMWAVLYGYREMVPIFSANLEKSKNQIMARWKTELSANELLYWMFPELLWPIRRLENKSQRCASQTYNGELTRVQWTADRIVLPYIPGVNGAGSILVALPLKSCRGATHATPDGTILRPDFCILDDVQKDEDADNQNTIRKLEDDIDHSVMMLGGHSQTMSVIMNCTVRKADDLSETYLRKPSWKRVRYKMLAKPATYEKEFWLTEYADIRSDYDPESPEDQRRAQFESLRLYETKKSHADQGAEVTWDWAYAWNDREPTEISAIQHAYNYLIDKGPSVFASECQNEPSVDTGGLRILKSSEMCRRLSGYQRGVVPRECKVLSAFGDIHEQIHYWQVWAWESDFTGYLIDYGTFPDQRAKYFQHTMLPAPLEKYFPGRDEPATIVAGLDGMLFGHDDTNFVGILNREWMRSDGVPVRVEKMGIDANGEYSKNIKQFVRTHQSGSILYPSFGRGIRATEPPISRWKRSKARSGQEEWIDTKDTPGDPIGTTFDANYWKTQFHKKIGLDDGSQGAIRFFVVNDSSGRPDETFHRMLTDHCVAEKPKEAICGTRVVYEFPQKFKGDNHYYDCAVGSMVAASKSGISSVTAAPPAAKPLSLADYARMAGR